MSIEKVVINASPFILLCKCGLIDLLPRLFTKIRMPESVSQEIIRSGDIAAERLSDLEEAWLNRCQVPSSNEVLAWNLGDGETEVLSLVFINKEGSSHWSMTGRRENARIHLEYTRWERVVFLLWQKTEI